MELLFLTRVKKCIRVTGWDFSKCKILSHVETSRKYYFGEMIKLNDYVISWGENDWLDTVDGNMTGILDAGEVMDILLKSDSFGDMTRGLRSSAEEVESDVLLREGVREADEVPVGLSEVTQDAHTSDNLHNLEQAVELQ